MKIKDAISEIIKINEVIINNQLDKVAPRTEEMQIGYNTYVKPLLQDFKNKHGVSERTLIKSILEKCNFSSINGLNLKSFGHWGQKINPFIWASFFIDNENKRPASHSIQLYMLIDHTGLKFGLDYGDKIENNNELVSNIKSDEETMKLLIDSINLHQLEVIEIKGGSPKLVHNHNREDNLIKTKEDFLKWNKDIHIIKTFAQNEIPKNIDEIIINTLNSLLPIYLNHSSFSKTEDVGYWLYSAGSNAKNWDKQFKEGYMSIDYNFPDDLNDFKEKQELINSGDDYGFEEGNMNTIKALWDFSKEINKGDVVISKKGRSKYLGYGIVTSDYIYDGSIVDYKHKRKVKWIKKGDWNVDGNLPLKTLTNITQFQDYVQKLKSKLGINENDKAIGNPKFNLEKVLENVFLDYNDFQNIIDILSTKKNIILQGSAGVGKTFIAKKIAQALQEDYREDTIEMIQFHQSYSYEDFIQGYRPNEASFSLQNGIFYDVCEKAKKDTSIPHFLIIDEINRGNLSKIFGELMMLIEADKRGEKNKIKLTYSSKNDFYVPDNLYIIGTMNTADRSLTIVDYALRRRFAFIKMKPNFDKQFQSFLMKKGISEELIFKISNKMKNLNNIISSDDSLGEGFEIGHSYFCSYKSGEQNKWLTNVIKYEIIPLIEEYWFDDKQLIEEYSSLIDL